MAGAQHALTLRSNVKVQGHMAFKRIIGIGMQVNMNAQAF